MKLERKSGTDAAEWFTQLGYVTIIILLLHPRSLIINYDNWNTKDQDGLVLIVIKPQDKTC